MKAKYRKRFIFWLNIMDDEDMKIAECIQTLKNQRLFTSAIRDGIRLIVDLRAGRVDVLRELFPDIIAKLDSKANALTPQDIDQIKRLIQTEPKTPLNTPSTNGAPRAMNVPTFRTPTFDDSSGDDLVLKKDTSTNAGKNFLQSMMNLQA